MANYRQDKDHEVREAKIREAIEEEVLVFPASFAQQRLWFIDQLMPGTASYTIPIILRLTGNLNRSALKHSLEAIVRRHEVLRTTFDVVDGQLIQVVHDLRSGEAASCPIQVDLPIALCSEELALQQIRQITQQPFDLRQGTLFRFRLWQIDETDHLLLMALHHIIFDEWSSGVLIRELGEFYAAGVRNGLQSENRPPCDRLSILPEMPVQYGDFAHWQRQWLQGNLLKTQLDYWRQQLRDLSPLNLSAIASVRHLSDHSLDHLLDHSLDYSLDHSSNDSLNDSSNHSKTQNHQGASQLVELPQNLLDELETLSQNAGVTLFMTLLAAFQTLLHRYTGQTDIAIGSPIANRHRSELEGLIGFLVNSLVLRSDLSDDPPFRVLLDRVRETTLAAYAHQDLPFEKLVEELQPVRSLHQNPLFQVVFALQNTPMSQLELPGLTLSPVAFETETTRFDLELYLWKCDGDFRSLWGKGWQRSDGLRGVIVYNRNLFDEAAIVRLRQQFQCLLEGIVAQPETCLSAFPLMTRAEQQQILDRQIQSNDLSNDLYSDLHPDLYSDLQNVSVKRLFEIQAQQQPRQIALQFGQHQFTYGELNHGSNQLARYLTKLGIRSGMRVGIGLGQSAETIAAMLAILKVGAAYVPLDPDYPLDRLRFMIEDAELRIVLTDSRSQHLLKDALGSANRAIYLDQEWETIAQESGENLENFTANDQSAGIQSAGIQSAGIQSAGIQSAGIQPAYVMYTSGSTGTPKGVIVPHQAIARLVCNPNYVPLQPGMRIAQAANLAFDAATFEVWGALLNGGCLVGIDREKLLSPADFTQEIRQQRIEVMFLTTALLNQTVSQIPDAFRSLTYLLFGGEAANPDRIRTILRQGKPQHLIHVYGPTENTTFSTWYEVENVSEDATTIPIGQAIANTQVYVLDTNLMPVPLGVVGEIYLGGKGLAQGYLNQPQLTAERFVNHPLNQQRLYKTGDRARYDANGNLEFLGRTDHQVKIRGFRIELGEIEAILTQYPDVETAVVAVREGEADRQLIAYLVPESGRQLQLTETHLRHFLKTHLPAYLMPAAFVMLESLPLTPNGKVNHRALPSPVFNVIPPILPAALPTTSLEQSLVNLWQQLLGRTVGIHDNFFELGGHSLLATQLVSRLRDRFQVELPLRDVFEFATIAALATRIEAIAPQLSNLQFSDSQLSDSQLSDSQLSDFQHSDSQRSGFQHSDSEDLLHRSLSAAPSAPIAKTKQPQQTASFPLSFAQQRLWFLYQLSPDNPFYNVTAAIRLTGSINPGLLERSFNEISRRHAALRTTFAIVDGEPVQIISPDANIPLSTIDLRSLLQGTRDTIPGARRDRDRIIQQFTAAEFKRPFNLTIDLPVRVTLLQVDEQVDRSEAILLLTLHHIVADGWSLGILIQELAEFYGAGIEGRAAELAPLPIQYGDFACWQRQWFQGDVLEKQLAYWRSQLQDVSRLDLLIDYPRPGVQTYRGATVPLQFSPRLTKAIEDLCQRSGVSLFMTLLAAFQTLMHRYTGQTDIAIGSPIANRHRSELEGLIGFFVNSLVMRSDLSGNPTFRELLMRVRNVALEAYQHQDLPFEKLVEELDPERDLSSNPLFQVAFALQNAPMQPLELPGVQLTPLPLEPQTTRFDLEVHLWEPNHGLRSLWQSEAGLSGFIAYSTDLFDRSTIERLVGHFQTLLENIVAHPDARLSGLPLLMPAERQQLLADWNQTELDFSCDRVAFLEQYRGFHGLFEQQAQQFPQRIAIVTEFASLSYAEVNAKADRLAQSLRQIGVQQNELIGLCTDRSADWLIGILGILKAGAAYVPIDPSYPGDRIAFILSDTQMKVLLTQSELIRDLPESNVEIICLDRSLFATAEETVLNSIGDPPPNPPSIFSAPQERVGGTEPRTSLLSQSNLPSQSPPFIGDLGGFQDSSDTPVLPNPSSLAYVIYTSGSTGIPKGVMLTHWGLCNVVAAQRQLLGLSDRSPEILPEIRVLQFSSISFDASVFEMALAIGSGGTLYIPPKAARMPGADLIHYLQEQAISHALLTPAVLAVLPAADLPDLETLITGGEACPPTVIDRWAVNRRFFNAYGPTETTIWATVAELRPGDEPLIGRPVANTQVYVLDTQLQPVPIGIMGELYVGGAGVAQGYLNRPDLTERFIPSPFHPGQRLYRTGDRVRYRANGNLEFCGRSDDQIKIRGFRVEPGEIEAILQRHSAIREAIVLPVGESFQDKQLVAYFSLNNSIHNLSSLLESGESQAEDTLQAQQVGQWQRLYNQTYSPQTHTPADPTFNITGWNSSYTGKPIPAEQMREWLDDRIQQIRALQPKRVLEIGCGTGLLLFQIAPHCEVYYGTDFSAVSLQTVQQQIDRLGLAQVKLLERSATDFSGIEPAGFDMVILNSVVQYFPSVDYLLEVIAGAMQSVRPGGAIFLGDVRSLPLLTAFHAGVQLFQAEGTTERPLLQQQVERSRFEESELAIDPAFFPALRQKFPRIQRVQIRLAKGHHRNEMTQFRYSVVLQLEGMNLINENTDRSPSHSIQWMDWRTQKPTVSEVKQYLLEHQPDRFGIKNIANDRIYSAVQTAEWLYRKTSPKTVEQFRKILQNSEKNAIDPQNWWDLETVLPYQIEMSWAIDRSSGDYDVAFIRHNIIRHNIIRHNITTDIEFAIDSLIDLPVNCTTHQPDHSFQDLPWHHYTNNPLQSQIARQIIPALRTHLRQTLPDYMIPSAFIPLETLPLNANGKIDRVALLKQNPCPVPLSQPTGHFDTSSSTSHTPTELALLDIWKELLRQPDIDPNDSFFELGGHSLLATQMTSRIRDRFNLELPLRCVFETPTIAQLSPIIDDLSQQSLTDSQHITRLDRSTYRRSRSNLSEKRFIASSGINSTPHSGTVETQSHHSDRSPFNRPKNYKPENNWSPLVPLTIHRTMSGRTSSNRTSSNRTSSQQSPFFCVHPIFGVVFPYLELAQLLETDFAIARSFYGLQPLGLDGKQLPFNRIPEMAAYYINAIRTVQPHGPYFLGGWSFGGLVAYEMAQQLTQAGESIALLAILDTPAPLPAQQPSLLQNLKFLLKTALWSTLPFLLNYSTLLTHRFSFSPAYPPPASSLSHSPTSRQWSALTRLLPDAQLRLLDESAIVPLLRIFYANSRSVDRYRPKPYTGTLTLFKAANPSNASRSDPAMGWDALCDRVQVHSVPGNHLSMLKPPHVQELAQQLQIYLS